MNVRSVIIGIFVIGAITSIWYITQPMIYSVIAQSENVTATLGANRTEGDNTFTILYLLNIVWGPALILVVIGWMLISAQRDDWRSAEQPGGYR